MIRRLPIALLAFVLACHKREPATLIDLGPRIVSNQTSQPLALVGHDFVQGMQLELGPPFSRTMTPTVIDRAHAYVRLPADLTFVASSEAAAVPVRIAGQDEKAVMLRVINDAAFPDVTTLVASGTTLFAASTTTDSLYVITDTVKVMPTGDGPTALAVFSENNESRLAIAHAWEPTIWICNGSTGEKLRTIAAPAYASNLIVHDDAFVVTEQARDTVLELAIADGKVRWSTPVDPNPKSLALADRQIAVGSALTGRIELLDVGSGERQGAIEPTPKTTIVGGHTEPFGKYIMGGKGERALAYNQAANELIVASIGPNIGPNPDKMEVSMNGGVGIIDLSAKAFTMHLGFGFGTPETIVVDQLHGLAYVSDIGAGLVRVVDLAKLHGTNPKIAELWSIPIPPAKDFPLTRPIADFDVNNRSGVELHSGPQALALSGDTLYVMNRFSGTLASIDVASVKSKAPVVAKQRQIVDTLQQRERRLGQILYFTDLGRTGMACESCHLEGHADGVLFEKTVPLRIYRNPTIRGAAETPPYFTPASTFSIAETIRKVGDRNRFQNPVQTADEVKRLTGFASGVTTLPNPFVGDDGAPPETLTLLDGAQGRPRKGLATFERQCASCHPAPYFTQDQSAATRNRYIEVGTPHLLGLRPEMQNARFEGLQIPALIGAWDVWPMLNTGSAGYAVAGDMLEVHDRFALRAVIERYSGAAHGNAQALAPDQRNDLLAYLMTL